jgi:hypothetical protein
MRSTRTLLSKLVAPIVLATGALACTASTDGASEAGGSAPATTVTHTAVRLSPDGNHRVTVTTIDRATGARTKRRAGNLEIESIVPDTNDQDCDIGNRDNEGYEPIIIYDEANRGGNMICFFGVGTAHLADYCAIMGPHGTCAAHWNEPRTFGEIMSYETGAQPGFFSGGYCSYGGPCKPLYFGSYQPLKTVFTGGTEHNGTDITVMEWVLDPIIFTLLSH